MAIATNVESDTEELNNKRLEGQHLVVHLPMISDTMPAEEGETKGCINCQQGCTLVLFVPENDHWGCDYCPLSENCQGSPYRIANERCYSTLDEITEKSRGMKSTGTEITGRDPMLDPERSVEAVSKLKKAFGPEHHIHLYTSISFKKWVVKLAEAGFDELRFHLLNRTTR